MYQATQGTNRLLTLNKRIRGVAGGTGASKTISILLILIDIAQSREGVLISVVAESVPHLRRGAMRDFIDIMKTHNYYREDRFNKGDSIYTFETGSQIEFFAADQADKLRGGRRDILFINEANNISFSAFNELEIRTRETIWLDWNPTSLFWFYEELQPYRDDIDHITLTYKDNEALEKAIIDSIEARKNSNPNWYKVYGLGEIGSLEGLIFDNWEVIEEIPEDARLERRGLDFGYTNDPSFLGDIYKWNDGFVIDEQLYATGLSNRQIAEHIKGLPEALTVADSAEPKSIDEIKSHGVWIKGSDKGQDSVRQGIQLMQDYRLYITQRSVNVIKDFRNYQWKTDRSGKPLNVPEHPHSHSADGVRYGITDIVGGRVLTEADIAL